MIIKNFLLMNMKQEDPLIPYVSLKYSYEITLIVVCFIYTQM